LKGYLTVTEVADKYGISRSTAQVKLSPHQSEAKPIKANRHFTLYYPVSIVKSVFRQDKKGG